jgi:hypothetical protein
LIFGYIFPAEYVTDNCRVQIANAQFICAVISSLVLVICVVYIKNKPKSPPGKKYMQVKRPSFKKSFQLIFCNGQNLFNISILAMFLGLAWSIFDVLGKISVI